MNTHKFYYDLDLTMKPVDGVLTLMKGGRSAPASAAMNSYPSQLKT